MRASCSVVGPRPGIVTRGNARGPRGLPYAEPVLLSDRDIRAHVESGRLGIDPFDPQMVQPSSVDVRLDGLFRVFNNTRYTHIDPKQRQDELTTLVEPDPDEPFVLHPGEFVLGSTLEVCSLPDDLAGRLEGKSSLGRLGLPVLEAMAHGTPVVTSADTCMAEITGDDAGLLVPATSASALAVALEAAAGPEHQRLAAAGLRRARDFTWEASAAAHALLYESLAGTR